MKVLYLVFAFLILITTVHGQIVLEPVVTGTVRGSFWTCYALYYTTYDAFGPNMFVLYAGNGSCYGRMFIEYGVMEFPVDLTVHGGAFPTTQMTVSNWTAKIDAIEFGNQISQSPGLYKMNDGYEDGIVSVSDYYSSNAEDLIAILLPDNPGGSIVSDIDITESLREDIFGAGTGDLTSGYLLKPSHYDHWVSGHADHENLRISVTRLETPTPIPTSTLTPTPSPTPVTWRGVNLILPGSPFTGEDSFKLRAQCMGDPDDSDVNLYVILDVYGEYWFHPGWTEIPQYETIALNPSRPVMSFVLDFIWPDNIQGSVDGLYFWGAILDQETSDLIGDFDRVEFGYY